MTFTPPQLNEKSFNCPLCNTYAHMKWSILSNANGSTLFTEAYCSCCKESSVWRVTKYEQHDIFGRQDLNGEMIFPDVSIAAPPENDMPDDVKIDYIEAAAIFSKSPRGSAALLRLGLQKLCKHLGQDGKNINTDIRNLAAKNIIPPLVVNVADAVRITGNNAVHPGEMSDEDFDLIASKMFDFINFIVKKGISEPKELQELYGLLPEGARKSAEDKDAKSRTENA